MSPIAALRLLEIDTNSPICVLVIDDSEADYGIIKNLLEYQPNRDDADPDRPKFVTIWAETFTKGMELSIEQEPDLILLDYFLPDSEGLGGLEELVKNQPTIPVILLTGVESEELGKNAVALGAQDYLPKTKMGWQELTRKIRYSILRHLRRSRGVESPSGFSKDTADWKSYRAAIQALKQSVPQ